MKKEKRKKESRIKKKKKSDIEITMTVIWGFDVKGTYKCLKKITIYFLIKLTNKQTSILYNLKANEKGLITYLFIRNMFKFNKSDITIDILYILWTCFNNQLYQQLFGVICLVSKCWKSSENFKLTGTQKNVQLWIYLNIIHFTTLSGLVLVVNLP